MLKDYEKYLHAVMVIGAVVFFRGGARNFPTGGLTLPMRGLNMVFRLL